MFFSMRTGPHDGVCFTSLALSLRTTYNGVSCVVRIKCRRDQVLGRAAIDQPAAIQGQPVAKSAPLAQLGMQPDAIA